MLPHLPAEDAPLLRHIRKQKQRAGRKRLPAHKKSNDGFNKLFGDDDASVRVDARIGTLNDMSSSCCHCRGVCVCACVVPPDM